MPLSFEHQTSAAGGSGPPSTEGTATRVWSVADRLVASMLADGEGIEGLQRHKLGPYAAGWYERSGQEVPTALHEEQRSASLASMIAVPLTRRLRESAEGPLLLLKGPEIAALYPPSSRRFSDIDVLTPHADQVQAALLASGFVEVVDDSYTVLVDHHHLQPIRFPTIWLNVEVHSAPNWPSRAPTRPPLAEILDAAIPSALGVEGVSAPSRAHHALMLASHSWRHEPLACLRDLLDIAVLIEGLPAHDLEATARRWGIARLWRTTRGAVDALLGDGRQTIAVRVLGRHLRTGRGRTVFENHLVPWVAPCWGLPPGPALAEMLERARRDFTPGEGETWRLKLTRTASAVRHPRSSASGRG